jgi:hypothetical protein
MVQSSLWPTLLSSDSTAKHGVQRAVAFLDLLLPIAVFLIAVAGVVTPLGLSQPITPGSTVVRTFQYVPDTSPIGFGTPPRRSDLGFSRVCGDFGPVACPGTNVDVIYNPDAVNINDTFSIPHGYDTRIPQNVSDFFSSGTINSTISNSFDIQWRQYSLEYGPGKINGSVFVVGSYRQLQTMILDNRQEVIEGLVVDTITGGVGLRNHTVPIDVPYGATWSEDLLFLEPETQCVNTNLTFDFSISSQSGATFQDLVLTDRGGFSNLTLVYPEPDLSDPQSNPDLWGRAYKGAWMNNVETMVFFNVTRPAPHGLSYMTSHVGKTFDLGPQNRFGWDSLTISDLWGYFLNDLLPSPNYTDTSNFSSIFNSSVPLPKPPVYYPNPFKITLDNFTDISELLP